jgi:hypothetical protein
VDVFVFYDVVQYTKNDWRNRNKICGPNGAHWLTIPIAKNAVKKKIEEVFLPSGCWRDSHIKSLRQAYSKAPFFGVIEDRVDQWFYGENFLRLSALNQSIITDISEIMGIKTKFLDASIFPYIGDRIGRLLAILEALNATSYLTGPSALGYLALYMNEFKKRKIDILVKKYEGYLPYPHPFEPFQHEISILDMLAYCDPQNYPAHLSSSDTKTLMTHKVR